MLNRFPDRVIDLAPFQGPRAFGPAYNAMWERDTHAPGSVDCVLASEMVRMCPETVNYLYGSSTPTTVKYSRGSRPGLESILATLSHETLLKAICQFTRRLGERTENDLEKLRFGGTEEQIIARGSDWCTDVARVAGILYQIAGFPSRLVYLFNPAKAYHGHVIVEVFQLDRWRAVDPTVGTLFASAGGTALAARDLSNHGGQFARIAIANYFVADHSQYDYTESGINDYFRSILKMSAAGWPGGPRWLHGEDQSK